MWIELTKLLGFGAIFLWVAAWLIRQLVGLFISRDIEAYKAQLAAEMQRSLLEHEVRFRSLHAKRAEVILELHAKLARTVKAAGSFISPLGFAGEPDKQEKHRILMQRLGELFDYFDENRILLDRDLDVQAEACIDSIRKPTWEYSIHVWHPGEFDGEYEKWKVAWDSLREGEIKETVEALRSEFRRLLGVHATPEGDGGG